MPDLNKPQLHRLTVAESFKHLEDREGGLSPEEAQQRLSRYGPRALKEPSHYSLIRGFLHQFTHFLPILLWIATALSFTAEFMKPGEGMATLGWAILGVIVINAVFAFFQEYKAERAVHALHRLLPARAWVLQSNQPHDVSRREIVPGDVLLIEEGEQIAADARLVEASDMRVDLSSLRGESLPKRRTAEPVTDGHLLDIPNLVFAGTPVLSGRGRAVVLTSGMQTEFGKIARLSTSVETDLSPLQKEITKLTRIVALISLAMGASFFSIGLWTGLGFWISAIFGIGIIAANVPEVVPYLAYGFLGMPLALTIPQVLAIDLGTDMVPAIALGAEPPHPGIMDVPPRPKSERLLTIPLLLKTYFFLGLDSACMAMGGFFLYLFANGWSWETPLDWSSPLYREATTVTFAGVVLAQVAIVFSCRSDRLSVTRFGWVSNPLILWGVVIEITVLALTTSTPLGNDIFRTGPLPAWIFGPLALGALVLLFAEEIRKIIVKRFTNRRAGDVTQQAGTS